MNTPNYIEIIFSDVSSEQSDSLIALLSDYGFEGFEEEEWQLKAYIKEIDFNTEAFPKLLESYRLSYKTRTIPSQNWNAVWETQFEPVLINAFVGIRADFHLSFAGKVEHEIVITPKMSFGTGHHATTYMMIEQMEQLDFTNKQVLDFGTGTGILAILSEKLGAARVLAIDIDEWSITNAAENIKRNNCAIITLQQADNLTTNDKYDIILANINKNIILQNMQQLSVCLNSNACLLLSGLLAEDEGNILAKTNLYKLKHINTKHRQQWISMLFAG